GRRRARPANHEALRVVFDVVEKVNAQAIRFDTDDVRSSVGVEVAGAERNHASALRPLAEIECAGRHPADPVRQPAKAFLAPGARLVVQARAIVATLALAPWRPARGIRFGVAIFAGFDDAVAAGARVDVGQTSAAECRAEQADAGERSGCAHFFS